MYLIKKIHEYLANRNRAIARMILATLIFLFGATVALSIFVGTVTAGPGQPFGGMIFYVQTCTCSGNFAVFFVDLSSSPVGLPLIYQPGFTTVYQFGPPLSLGRWMLGTWTGGGLCKVWAGKFCFIVPTAGTMFMVGTSQ